MLFPLCRKSQECFLLGCGLSGLRNGTPFSDMDSYSELRDRIIQRLNDVYLEFAQSLGPPLTQLALTPSTFSFHRHAGDKRSSDYLKNLELVDISLPLMLTELFCLSQSDLFAIAASGMFGLFAVSLYDVMFDQELFLDPNRMLLQNLLYAKALSYLYALFDQSSLFWHYHRVYFREYFGAISAEQEKHYRRISAYDKAEFYALARGKSAPRKILLAAMAILDGKDVLRKIESIAASLDAYAIAAQILDDILDWKEDLCDRRFSYLLTQIITAHGLESRIDVGTHPGLVEVMEVAMRIVGSGELQALLDEAHGLYEEAIHCVEGLKCPEWKLFLTGRAEACVERKHSVGTLVGAVTRWLSERRS